MCGVLSVSGPHFGPETFTELSYGSWHGIHVCTFLCLEKLKPTLLYKGTLMGLDIAAIYPQYLHH